VVVDAVSGDLVTIVTNLGLKIRRALDLLPFAEQDGKLAHVHPSSFQEAAALERDGRRLNIADNVIFNGRITMNGANPIR